MGLDPQPLCLSQEIPVRMQDHRDSSTRRSHLWVQFPPEDLKIFFFNVVLIIYLILLEDDSEHDFFVSRRQGNVNINFQCFKKLKINFHFTESRKCEH